MPESPSPLRRLDAGLLPRLRRLLLPVVRVVTTPVRVLTRWESAPARPGLVRTVVARPGMVALAAALVVFVASATHLARFETAMGSGAGEDQVVQGDAPDDLSAVGPRVGGDLEVYVEDRREVLAEFDDEQEVRAVVSFTSYLGADGLELPAELTLERLLVRLPVVDEDPREIEVEGRDPAQLLGTVAAQERDRLSEEEEELASLLESDIEDEEFVREFERRLEELEEVRGRLADDPALLYAVVVVGSVEVLGQVQASGGVRLVDPGGDPDETRRTQFFGLLPEDEDRASYGRSL